MSSSCTRYQPASSSAVFQPSSLDTASVWKMTSPCSSTTLMMSLLFCTSERKRASDSSRWRRTVMSERLSSTARRQAMTPNMAADTSTNAYSLNRLRPALEESYSPRRSNNASPRANQSREATK